MSAIDILNEIRGEHNSSPEITPVVEATAQSPVMEALLSKAEDIYKKLDLQKLTADVDKSETVSKELAMEVFTMLPPMVNYSNHMTKAPSAYNRSFVMSKITPYDAKEEIRGFLSDLLQEVWAVKPLVEKLKSLTQAFKSLALPEMARFVKHDPMVIHPGGKLNLLGDGVSTITQVDDRLFNYPPYEGQLTQKYTDLLYSKFYSELLKYDGGDDMSLASIVRKLIGISDFYEGVDKYLLKLEQNLSYDVSATGTKYVIEDAFNLLQNVMKDTVLFDGEECIANRVLVILKFLK